MNLTFITGLLILTNATLLSLNVFSQESTNQYNRLIFVFLKTLTGDQPSFALPILPPSTDKTPQPQPFE